MNWFSLYKHLSIGTKLEIVSDSVDYRKLARTLPTAEDVVLEIGCSVGLATVYLSKSAKEVFAIDHSVSQLEEARVNNQSLLNVQWLTIDAREVDNIKLTCPEPKFIFMDIGGNIQLGNIASLLRLYLINFKPSTFVIKSTEFAIMSQLIQSVKLPTETRHLRQTLDSDEHRLENLLALSHSHLINDRVFAARQLQHLKHPQARSRLNELTKDPSAKIRRICGNANYS